MKKTIAILLILVIGMVGVFAAPSDIDLHLKTTVTAIHEMRITADDSTPAWLTDLFPEGVQTFEASDSVYGTDLSPKVISFNTTDPQEVGYLHVRTNYIGSVVVKVKAATTLTGTGTNDEVINYEVRNTAGLVFSTNPAEGVVNTFDFLTIAAKGANAAGLRAGAEKISVVLLDAINKTADDYTGYITFEYTIP